MKLWRILVLVLIFTFFFIGCGPKPGKIELNENSLSFKYAGKKSKLMATVYDTNGNYFTDTKQPLVWNSSDMKVATVDSSGNVEAIGTGTCTVTASVGALSKDVTVNVLIVKSVTVTPSYAKMNKGDITKFKAVVKDEKGNILSIPVSWKTDAGRFVHVNNNGKVRALRPGKTYVWATAQGKTGSAKINVAWSHGAKVGGIKTKGKLKKY